MLKKLVEAEKRGIAIPGITFHSPFSSITSENINGVAMHKNITPSVVAKVSTNFLLESVIVLLGRVWENKKKSMLIGTAKKIVSLARNSNSLAEIFVLVERIIVTSQIDVTRLSNA